jgi:hypothetical protein
LGLGLLPNFPFWFCSKHKPYWRYYFRCYNELSPKIVTL